MGSIKKLITASVAFSVFGLGTAIAITPNKLVSGRLPAYAGSTTTDYLTDGYLTNWKSSNAKEIALNVGAGPTKLRINWESYGDCAWATNFTSGCGHTGVALSNFKILTSANSTDGTDGNWDVAATITNNPVMARGVNIDFAGKSWFKFVSSGDVGQILEIEAFDMSNGGTDTWFFMGTSISQMGIKQQDTDSTTAQLIHAKFPNYTPAMLRGGIGCINSTEVVAHLKEYLEYAGNVKFWAIEMGTNDAWGGGDWNLDTFKKNMQTIIDSAKAHGITPIIARIIATDSAKAGWQVNPAFLEAVDKLTEDNNLPKGPDFYTYFKKHPEQLASDGVHPNGDKKGGQAMHHLWAEALAPLYAAGDTASVSSADSVDSTITDRGDSTIAEDRTGANKSSHILHFHPPRIYTQGRNIAVENVSDDIVDISIVSATGRVFAQKSPCQQTKQAQFINIPTGKYIILLRDKTKQVISSAVLSIY
ncbi:SGNH/GDSL hydrolase family protein [uncultured Fibrobacter sp.]|uniref:SGNH/GDSL hydrolase family protein n=1 Tax=uncultured Fibrobacter sp. TaxID=261512 RepID=UPI0025E791A5|nr:SGNH/GDSL hydrolase family protein [uncultured Fibrobacter sp.]